MMGCYGARAIKRQAGRSAVANGMVDTLAEGLEAGMGQVARRWECCNGSPGFARAVLRDACFVSLYLVKNRPQRYEDGWRKRNQLFSQVTSVFTLEEETKFGDMVHKFDADISMVLSLCLCGIKRGRVGG